jgi:hypothetical protein
MSGCLRSPSTFDETLVLAEALERALSVGDEPTSMTVPTLAELCSLVKLARRVEASAQAVGPTQGFHASARARLMASMWKAPASSASLVRQPPPQSWRLRLAISGWFTRVAAALSAVALAGAATASASASALPGDPLYAIKQAGEQVAMATATDGAARQQLLVRQAETRLDETSRLLEQGRDAEAGLNALRYSEVLEATAGAVAASEPVETSLQAGRERLASLLVHAPLPARPGLQRALGAAERGLAQRAQRRLAAVEQVAGVRPELTPTTVTPAVPTATSPGDAGEAATTNGARANGQAAPADQRTESGREQSRHDAAPKTVEDGHAAGGAASPVGRPERPPLPAPAVNNARGAPVIAVHPTPHGRP